MAINWKKGLLRAWVVASIFWVIGIFVWQIYLSSERFDRDMNQYCTEFIFTEQWNECFDTQQERRDQLFWTIIISLDVAIFFFIPPLLTLGVGAILLKIAVWIGHGFYRDSN